MAKKIANLPKALRDRALPRVQPFLDRFARPVLAVVVVAAVSLFFYFSMSHTLRSFRGNYSGFIRISNQFGGEGNPLFRQDRAPLLFANSDFEYGTLENWQSDGDAFAFQPTLGDNLTARRFNIPSNHQGRYWIGTYEKYQGRPGEVPGTIQGDVPFGELTSVPFTIQEERIAFLVGGGEYKVFRSGLRTYVGLEVDGEIVRKASGRNSELMEMQVWDVARWRGKTARIIINDAHAPTPMVSFKHINADYFHYYRENPLQRSLLISPSGYDGQFFYLIAFDPFLQKFRDQPNRYYQILDEPAYRLSRIGFPLLVRAFSLGRAEWFPRTMVWLILLSYPLGAFFLVRILMHFGRSPLWGLFYLLIPGFQVSLHTALPEPISAALLLGGLFFCLRQRPLAALPFFALAVLVRETAALLVVLLIIHEIIRGSGARRVAMLAASLLPLVAWKAFLTWRLFPLYGWKTLWFSPGDFALPLSGFLDLFRAIRRGAYLEPVILPATVYPILLILVFAFAVYFLVRKPDFLSVGFFLYSLMSLLLNFEKIWCHVDNGVRTTYEAFLLLIVVFARGGRDERPPALAIAFLALCAGILFYDAYASLLAPVFRAGLLLSP
jgi:hypothetical protein